MDVAIQSLPLRLEAFEHALGDFQRALARSALRRDA